MTYADGDHTTPHNTSGIDLDEALEAIDRADMAKWREGRKTRRTSRKATTHTQPREADIQRDVIDLCAKLGYLVVRVNSFAGATGEDAHDNRFVGGSGKQGSGKRFMRAYHVANINASAGHSDLVIYKDGRAWFLEVKRPGGELSAAQERFREACVRYGMSYHVVRSVDEARAVLENQ